MTSIQWRREYIQFKRGVRSIMVGRKRKLGKREANGRLSRAVDPYDQPMRYMDGFTRTQPTAIYVMEAAPLVKVGYSEKPSARTSKIQTSNGGIVRLAYYRWMEAPGAKHLEREFHKQFRGSPSHAHGEWYYMTAGAAIEAIESLLARLALWSIHPSFNEDVERVPFNPRVVG